MQVTLESLNNLFHPNECWYDCVELEAKYGEALKNIAALRGTYLFQYLYLYLLLRIYSAA